MITRPITRSHITQIKIAQKALNMEEEDYRAMLQRVAGVKSSTQLDMEGFAAVMAEFNRLGFESTAEAERRMQPYRAPGHATYAQKLKMQRLWDTWKGYPDKPGLHGWLKHKWGIENPKFMSSKEAVKAIGALAHFKKGKIMIKNIEVNNPELAQAILGAPLEALELVAVSSDSMEPALFYGDQVFVDTRCKKFFDDAIYAFKIGDNITIRMAQLMFGKSTEESICVFSLDKRYGKEYVSPETFEKTVVGRVTQYKFGKFQTYTNQNIALKEALTVG